MKTVLRLAPSGRFPDCGPGFQRYLWTALLQAGNRGQGQMRPEPLQGLGRRSWASAVALLATGFASGDSCWSPCGAAPGSVTERTGTQSSRADRVRKGSCSPQWQRTLWSSAGQPRDRLLAPLCGCYW